MEEQLDLDTTIIDEFEKDDELYNDFYKDKIEQINLYILYVDNNNDLFHIKKDTATLNNGKLEKDDLKNLIRQYIKYQNKKYRLISLLKWNITIEPEEISDYLRNEKKFDAGIRSSASGYAMKARPKPPVERSATSVFCFLAR